MGGVLACGQMFGGVDLRPMDGVACGQKSGKIFLENLREYFRVVFVVFALFSQYNHFFGLRKDAKGAKRAKIDSLRELYYYVTQKSRKSQKFYSLRSCGSLRERVVGCARGRGHTTEIKRSISLGSAVYGFV